MQFSNQSGASIINVMVGFALLGALSYGVMQVTKNISQNQALINSVQDETEIKSHIRMILDNPNFCRISLAGDGPEGHPLYPVKFKKADIDEETEGLDIELWYANQLGTKRATKKFSATDIEAKEHGKVTIKSMKLIMNNGTGENYSVSDSHSDIGLIKIVTGRKGSGNDSREMIHRFSINIGMRTDAGGQTTILSCSTNSASTGGAAPECRKFTDYNEQCKEADSELAIASMTPIPSSLQERSWNLNSCSGSISPDHPSCIEKCHKEYESGEFVTSSASCVGGRIQCNCRAVQVKKQLYCCRGFKLNP